MSIRIIVEAGWHDRVNCPVSVKIEKKLIDGVNLSSLCLATERACEVIKVQTSEDEDYITVHWIIDYLPKKEKIVYMLCSGNCVINSDSNLAFGNAADNLPMKSELADDLIKIYVNGQHYTNYYFGRKTVKPYLGPFFGKYGEQITRLDFSASEHPHHRSLWFSHGNVNGVDTWNEPQGRHGRIINKSVDSIINGNVYTCFVAKNVWTDFNETPLLNDETTITFYNTPRHLRILDAKLTLTAGYGKVTLGSTKEAGPIAIRVSDNLTVNKTGTIVNGYGGINEEEIWMKRAPWCDYFGVEEGHTSGISIFDHPENPDYPSYWHARNYGLFAPNNFYKLGDRIIEPGQSITYNYRVIIHSGDTWSARIGDRYHDYVNPPDIQVQVI